MLEMNLVMMMSSNGNIFHDTGHLCREFTDHRWIPLTKASDVELWCFLLICAWTKYWVNNCEAGDLRRHHAHYDVTVMWKKSTCPQRMCVSFCKATNLSYTQRCYLMFFIFSNHAEDISTMTLTWKGANVLSHELIHQPPGDVTVILRVYFSNFNII